MWSSRRKLDLPVSTTLVSSARFLSSSLVATIERMENTRSASLIDSVPAALFLRPVNGKVSGPRWHWALMLMRLTWWTRMSVSWAISEGSVEKMDACWPNSHSVRYLTISSMFLKVTMGTI